MLSRRSAGLLALILLAPSIVWAQGVDRERGATGRGLPHFDVRVLSLPPSPWEREMNGVYENKGISRIEKVMSRYLLTTYCNGIHSIYVRDDKTANLEDYVNKFVHVRYAHIEEINFDVKCVRASCEPIIERKVIIKAIEEIRISEDKLREYETSCTELT